MKLVILLFSFLPITLYAQHTQPSYMVPKQPIPKGINQALIRSANIRLYQLPNSTVMFHHLNDTVSSKYATPLQAGRIIFIRATYTHWLGIHLAKNPTQFADDTTTYYIPKNAINGAKIYIML